MLLIVILVQSIIRPCPEILLHFPFFIIGNENAKVGSQEIPGVTGKSLALDYKMKQGKG